MRKFRYPGVNPFSREQQDIFFGREAEQQQLLQLIGLERLVVLHSKSGLGKSSLLNAGVIPALEREGRLLPIPIRFYAWTPDSEESPLDRVAHQLRELAGDGGSYLDKLFDGEPPTLWYYFKRIQERYPEREGFILICDQSEELFTYPARTVRAFATQLASALYEDIPQAVLNRFEAGYEQDEDFLSEGELERLHRPFLLKMLLAIRSDRLSQLDELAPFFPNILQRLFRLEALSDKAAEEAIFHPALRDDADFHSPRFDYTDEALEHIISYLSKGHSEKIESFQLQILCQHIEQELVMEDGVRQVDVPHIGDLDTIYEDYYARQIARIGSAEDQLAARRFIEEGLIQEEDRRRLSLHESQISRFYGISPSLLSRLVETRLIRPEPHAKGGYIYELSHDSIVAPILQAKAKRVESERRDAEAAALRRQEEALRLAAEENRRERRRLRIYRLGLVLGLLLLLVSGLTALLYFNNRQLMLNSEQLEIKSNAQRQIARSSQLTTAAMLESKIDRTLALHLAREAVVENEVNDIARTVRNELLISSAEFPFYNAVVEGHGDYVTDLALSDDGRHLLSACRDSLVRLWTPAGAFVRSFAGHRGAVTDVDFIGNDRFLSASDDGAAREWTIAGELVATYEHGAAVVDADLSPDGAFVVTAARDGSLRVFDRGGKARARWQPHRRELTNVQILPGNRFALSSAYDGTLRLTNLVTGADSTLIADLPTPIHNFEYDAGSRRLAAGMIDGALRLWAWPPDTTLLELAAFKAHANRITDVVFTADGRRLLTASWDKSARLWDLDGNLLKSFLGHRDGVLAVAIDQARELVITGGEDRTMKIWSLAPYYERRFAGARSDLSAVTFSPDGRRVLVGSYDGRVRTYTAEGRLVDSLVYGHAVYDVAVAPAGDAVLVGGNSTRPFLWPAGGGAPNRLPAHPEVVYAVAFAPDGQTLLTACADRNLRLFDRQGRLLRTLEGHTDRVLDAVFSPDGQYVLSAGKDNTVRLWRAADGGLLKTDTTHTDLVESVAFAPDNRRFLSGSRDNSFVLHFTDSDSTRTFLGHTSDVTCVAFSPDGQTMLSASSDYSVRLWDAASGREMPSLIRHPKTITDAAFSPDGRYVLTGSRDFSARLWRLGLAEEVVKSLPPLTAEQRGRYLGRE